MLKKIIKIALLFLFLGTVLGFDIPNYEGYVTDKVGVFSEAEKTSLTLKIEEIEKTTGIEIAILVVPTVDDDINLVAVDVGNEWGVGKAGQDNGVVLLIAIDDRKRAIQVGYGLEGTIPDLIADRMGEKNFPPNFRENNYYAGIMAMIDDFLGYIAKDPTIIQNYTQESVADKFGGDIIGITFFLLFIIIPLFGRFVTVSNINSKKRKMRKYGWLMYGGAGFILAFFITLFIGSFIASLFISYILLLFGVLMSMFSKVGNDVRGVGFWGSSGSRGGSSFGGFGGGSFGGGGSSGSR